MQAILPHLFLIYLTVDIQQVCSFCACTSDVPGDIGSELAEAFEDMTDKEQTRVIGELPPAARGTAPRSTAQSASRNMVSGSLPISTCNRRPFEDSANK